MPANDRAVRTYTINVRRLVVLGALVLACGLGVYIWVASQGRRVTPVADSQPAWSPDGGELAFTRVRGNAEAGYSIPVTGPANIYVIDSGGKHLRRLTRGGASDPAWSPDGKWIAFTGPGNQIWLVTVNGTDQHSLTRDPRSTGDGFPAWSPDGRLIAYISTQGSIYVINSDGGHRRRLISGVSISGDDQISWSPNGRTIAFARDDAPHHVGIWTVSVNNGHEQRVKNDSLVVTNNSPFLSTSGWVVSAAPAWSPDGSRLAFECGGGPNICVMGADGRHQRLPSQPQDCCNDTHPA